MDASNYPMGTKYKLTVTSYFFTADKGMGNNFNEMPNVRQAISNDIVLTVDNTGSGYGTDAHYDPHWVITFDRVNMPATSDYQFRVGAEWKLEKLQNGNWVTYGLVGGYEDEDTSAIISINL